ncbi:hypothetical protein F894_02957 [Acinetobacter sp. CIP 51.11]|uniref:AAA family ATPase n=1 Tax=Acinetobacter sp. CIP 51.11 TaxID=1144670 RepID=UPI0002D0C252|nr:AAA family ATPase [Acinetobacter sp. CIP 51.11]ENX12426.1 hypothetical protein F894_02957 [Acinetobacter sp. CIP 51.11]
MLLKIDHLSNFGIFQNFIWDETVLDKQSNIKQFKRLNVIYARNYSGKTTLSRLMQCIEFKQNNPYYNGCSYELKFENNQSYLAHTIQNCSRNVRVYNKDFVDNNLGWDKDSKGNIKAFSVMGQENIEIAKIIEKVKLYLEENINNPETFSYYIAKAKSRLIETEAKEKSETNKLKEECAKHARQLKENRSIYGVKAMYERTDLERDLREIKPLYYVPLSDEMIQKLELQIQDIEKSDIEDIKLNLINISTIWRNVEAILKEKVTPSQIIHELDQNQELSNWAFNGVQLHKINNLDNCSFCGSEISTDRLLKLDNYFDKKILELSQKIDDLIKQIESNNKKITNFINHELPNSELFYRDLQKGYIDHKKKLELELAKLSNFNQQLIVELNKKKNKLHTSIKIENLNISVDQYSNFITEVDGYVQLHNARNQDFIKTKEIAQKKLKDDNLFKFLLYIDYENTSKLIKKCVEEKEKAKQTQSTILENHQKFTEELEVLKTKRVSKESGLSLVNEYLNRYFSAHHLELVAKDNNTSFKIIRHGKEAQYLSEGECSLISFCYFMATLKDADLKETIVWIDDPISSLDNNNIFFIFGLIDSELCRPNEQNEGKYKQLFITTHNLEFFKYLKSIKPVTKRNIEYFIIERNATESHIKLIPEHIKKYSTEYHYLFSKIYQIHKISESEINEDISYNFGNNLRKFLEVHLAFKYPNNKDYTDNLRSFFSNGHNFSIINRVTNESSHLKEHLERGLRVYDTSEMKQIADIIITKLKENDECQFNELLSGLI